MKTVATWTGNLAMQHTFASTMNRYELALIALQLSALALEWYLRLGRNA